MITCYIMRALKCIYLHRSLITFTTRIISTCYYDFLKGRRHVTSYKYLKPFVPSHKVEFEVSKNPEEWKYVERLLPPKYVPTPQPLESYVSGWKPPTENAVKHPYFIPRNKNHMMPVYLKIRKRGTQRITSIKHIKGDLWAMEKDLRIYIKEHFGREVGMRIDEASGNIMIRGDLVHYVNNWMHEKGF